MSIPAFQPPRDTQNRKPDPRRLLLALIILLVGVLGAVGLAGYAPNKQDGLTTPAPSPTQVVLATPQRAPGLGGPQPPTLSPTSPTSISTDTPLPSTSTPPGDTSTPTVTPSPLSPALRSMRLLDNTIVPARDPYALTARLRLKSANDLPRTTSRPAGNYAVGHKDIFNISNIETRSYYTISATVRQVTEHAYWYLQDHEQPDMAALGRLAKAFEEKIYPKDRALFGSEWTPGVDNDPRITVLFAPLHGAGGTFSAADEYTRAVNPFSNEREIIYVSNRNGWSELEGTLAHEFQHMIHWHEHPNQDIWLNEGASVLAAAINGYDILGVDAVFMRNSNVQLNSWEPNPDVARPNYGAAFLFLDYLMGHYGGDKIIRKVINAPQPDMGAVDTALTGLGYKDRFADVVEKWSLANLLDNQPGADPAYSYPDRDVQVSPQTTLDHYPTGYSGQASQFGASYIELLPPTDGTRTLHVDFSGQSETRLIPAPAHSGTGIWWSNRGDLADSTMTRKFGLSGLQSATLDCYLWYDIEQDFDYAYAEASTDGGASWDTLKGAYTTESNPNGTNYGNAYTGKSRDQQGADANGWVHERLDLTPYTGKEVLVRFEYITDDGYNVQGLAVDDISVPEMGFRDDAESDTGWQGDGFVHVDNKLPQSYYLAVVRTNATGVDVWPIEVATSGEASFNIEGLGANGPYTKAYLDIVGLTPHNIQHPTYDLSVRPAK